MTSKEKIIIFTEHVEGTGTHFYLNQLSDFYKSIQLEVVTVNLNKVDGKVGQISNTINIEDVVQKYSRYNSFLLNYQQFRRLKNFVKSINPKYIFVSVSSEGKYLFLNFLQRRVIYTFHSMPKPSKSYLKQIVKIIAFKISFRRSVYVLPISKSVAANILKLWKIKSSHILPAVYTTSDKVNAPSSIADIDKSNNKIIIGSVGQTIEKKKVDIFIQVAKALTNKYGNDKVCFRWAGTGDNLEVYRNQVKCLGIEEVVYFLGFQQNLDGFYRSIDIYFHPSDDESFSLSVTEAMKHGKPILAVNIEAMREIITPEVNGLLAEPNCVEDIVHKLERLIMDPKTIHQIGANNAKFYLNYFSKSKWYDSMRQAHEFMITPSQKIFMEKQEK